MEKQYCLIAEFKKKDKKKVVKLIEKTIEVSIEDNFMFADEDECITIFDLTHKEANILFNKLTDKNYITNCTSQEMGN